MTRTQDACFALIDSLRRIHEITNNILLYNRFTNLLCQFSITVFKSTEVDTGGIHSVNWLVHSWSYYIMQRHLGLSSDHRITFRSGLFINSLAPERFQFNNRKVIFKLALVNGGWGISYEIALRWMPLDLTDDKSTLVQVMAWCRQATSHYLSQCWPRSISPNGATRPQWVKRRDVLSQGFMKPRNLEIGC